MFFSADLNVSTSDAFWIKKSYKALEVFKEK